MQQDYNQYQMLLTEKIRYLGEYIVLSGVISYLFYQSIQAFLIGFLFCPFFFRKKKKACIKKRKNILRMQFKDCLLSVSGAMRAGYSVENAWKEAEKDMEQQYGKESDICRELRHMNSQVDCNVPLEQVLDSLARRSHIEDIENFSGIFGFAKRSGGDFTRIIGNSVRQLRDKMELKDEIETVIGAKQMEQKVMNVVPLFILAFVNTISSDFLKTLYHNTAGVLIMSVALILYVVAYLWSEKIVDIEV